LGPDATLIQMTGAPRITTRATNTAFVEAEALSAQESVRRLSLAGSVAEAERAAAQGGEILPGLFMYGGEKIEGYQLHHLWPQALGGPVEGWCVYARNAHTAIGRIQQSLDTYLVRTLNRPLSEVREFARANPDLILPSIRDFYRTQFRGITFPY
jgi:hypothetical protein